MKLDPFFAELFEPTADNIAEELNNLLDEALLSNEAQIQIKHEEYIVKEEIEVEDEVIKTELLDADLEEDSYEDEVSQNDNKSLRECFVRLTKLPDSLTYFYSSSEFSKRSKTLKKELADNGIKCEGPSKNIKCKRIKGAKKFYAYNFCTYSTPQRAIFIAHLKTHSTLKPFKCDDCKFKTAHKSVLAKHIRRIHSGEKPNSCDLCDFRVFSKENLKYHHLRFHTEERPFKCDFCEFSTTAKKILKGHMVIHNEDRPVWSCNVCGNQYKNKPSLKRHIETTHQNEKRFACIICESQFYRKSSFESHLRTHTGEKPFKCHLCHFRAAEKLTVKHHVLSHSTVRPVTCYICNQSFKRKTYLPKHMKVVHNK